MHVRIPVQATLTSMNYDFLFRPAGLQTGKTPSSTPLATGQASPQVKDESDSMSSGEEDSKKLGGRHAEAKRRATNHQEPPPPPPLRTEGKPNLARFAKIDEAIKLDIAELHEIKMTRPYILTPVEAPKSAKVRACAYRLVCLDHGRQTKGSFAPR
jgi:hypothetical protein